MAVIKFKPYICAGEHQFKTFYPLAKGGILKVEICILCRKRIETWIK